MEVFSNPNSIGQLAIAFFIAIVFLQSGLDKIIDWKGNLSWLKGHFKDSILSGLVLPMLVVVTISEVIAGLVALCGIYCLFFCNDSSCILYSIIIAIASLLMLLFGQRIAKDYDGAKTIAIYLGVTVLGLLFF